MGRRNQGEAASGAVEAEVRTLDINRFLSICFISQIRSNFVGRDEDDAPVSEWTLGSRVVGLSKVLDGRMVTMVLIC